MSERHLTAEERREFTENGFVLLRGLLSPERLELARAIVRRAVDARDRQRDSYPDELMEMRAAEARGELIHPTTMFHVVEHMYQLWERFPEAAAYSLDPVLGALAAEALGVDHVRLWFDQVMIKEPGGPPTPYHQDNSYAPIDDDHGGCVTIWASLSDASDDMGVLRYVAGSHRLPRLPDVPLATPDGIAALLPGGGDLLARAVSSSVSAGDALLHHGGVIHGAGANTTDRPRPALLTCYFADGSRRRPNICHYVFDRDGVNVGDIAQGPGLPVVTRTTRQGDGGALGGPGGRPGTSDRAADLAENRSDATGPSHAT